MMRSSSAKGLRSPFGAVSALALTLAGVIVAALSVRAATVRLVPPTSPSVPGFVAGNPEIVLGKAENDLIVQRGILSPATLAAVRSAAAAAPLDARAYLVLGHQNLLDGESDRARKTLEAGRRLDPRNPVIHLLLLDRYLREKRYPEAATEFAVLSRLVGSARGPIAGALAQMSQAPETRDAARRTLRADPQLERSVLVTLAGSEVPAATVFDLASPIARRDAGQANNWGPVLVGRMVDEKQYAAARTIWRQVHGLPAAATDAPLYDAGLKGLPGSPPFNWTLTAGSLGAADMHDGTLSIDYYGRVSGDLASQLLVLRPGSYRFRFAVEGKTADGTNLFWSLQCANDPKVEPMHAAVKGPGPRRAIAAPFTIPAGCPAQRLILAAEAGEFPVPINVTLRDLSLSAVAGNRP